MSFLNVPAWETGTVTSEMEARTDALRGDPARGACRVAGGGRAGPGLLVLSIRLASPH